MRRITAANTAPGNLFRDANPGTGQKATSFNAQWANDVQESIMTVIEARGGVESAAYDALYRAMVDVAHPVTSYLILERGDSPSADWPWQTWVEVSGRVLVGLDEGQTEFNVVGKTGGAKTHILTVDEMPAHTHNSNTLGNNAQNDSPGGVGVEAGRPTSSAGGGQPHNNLQPYRVVRMWRRTA